MQNLWKRLHGEGLDVLAVNVGEDTRTIRAFLDGFSPKLEFPILLDEEGRAYRGWRVRGLPRTVIVDNQTTREWSLTWFSPSPIA